MVKKYKQNNYMYYIRTLLSANHKKSRGYIDLAVMEDDINSIYWMPYRQDGEDQQLFIKTKLEDVKEIFKKLKYTDKEEMLKGETEVNFIRSKVIFKPIEDDNIEITFTKPGFFEYRWPKEWLKIIKRITGYRKFPPRPYHDIVIIVRKIDLINAMKEILEKLDELKNKED